MGAATVAVLCIDMQNDFVLPTGKLFVKEAPSCIQYCQTLIECARQKGAPVFWVIREHDPSGATFTSSLAPSYGLHSTSCCCYCWSTLQPFLLLLAHFFC
ncbi:MAG: isochorismatase family protein [Bacteroidia bacterium]|nr:isochorismatase family protein [Bacteroidia bacterium]